MCLTNVQRHSGSPTAQNRLVREPCWVALEVRDQDRGKAAGILNRREAVGRRGATVQAKIDLASEAT
ncbi:MAG: hypothetical protein DMF51_04570 [Acidobacteria bacterium]|nr:MAG: hypothetical protein DMF51_04570 [Acidobacteriota bacterium]